MPLYESMCSSKPFEFFKLSMYCVDQKRLAFFFCQRKNKTEIKVEFNSFILILNNSILLKASLCPSTYPSFCISLGSYLEPS